MIVNCSLGAHSFDANVHNTFMFYSENRYLFCSYNEKRWFLEYLYTHSIIVISSPIYTSKLSWKTEPFILHENLSWLQKIKLVITRFFTID